MKIVLLNTSTLKDQDPTGERLLAAGYALLKTPHTYAEIVSLVLDTSSCMRVAIAVNGVAIAAVFYEDADLPGAWLIHVGYTRMFIRRADEKQVYELHKIPSESTVVVGWISPRQFGLLRFLASLGLFPTGRTVRANPQLIEFYFTDDNIRKASTLWAKRW